MSYHLFTGCRVKSPNLATEALLGEIAIVHTLGEIHQTFSFCYYFIYYFDAINVTKMI